MVWNERFGTSLAATNRHPTSPNPCLPFPWVSLFFGLFQNSSSSSNITDLCVLYLYQHVQMWLKTTSHIGGSQDTKLVAKNHLTSRYLPGYVILVTSRHHSHWHHHSHWYHWYHHYVRVQTHISDFSYWDWNLIKNISKTLSQNGVASNSDVSNHITTQIAEEAGDVMTNLDSCGNIWECLYWATSLGFPIEI